MHRRFPKLRRRPLGGLPAGIQSACGLWCITSIASVGIGTASVAVFPSGLGRGKPAVARGTQVAVVAVTKTAVGEICEKEENGVLCTAVRGNKRQWHPRVLL